MKSLRRILCSALSVVMLFSLSACTTPEEKEKQEADDKDKAVEIAEKYFDDTFEYDFDFYGGGGGEAAMDIYVFTDGETYNCVALPTEEDAPDARVYYDCYLHQFDSGRWQLQEWESSELAE